MKGFVRALVMALAAGFSATPAWAVKGSFIVVPPGLTPDNVEFFTQGRPPFGLFGQNGLHSDVWGNAFPVDLNAFGFGGPALNGNNQDGVFFPNLTIVDPGTPGAVGITGIRWSCGVNADGDPILCGPPADLWEEPPPGKPPKRWRPAPLQPVFFVLGSPPSNGGFPPHGFPPFSVPEPSAWTMMILGFGMTGGMLRRRRLATVSYG